MVKKCWEVERERDSLRQTVAECDRIVEGSAKTGLNVENAFATIGKRLLEDAQ